MGSLSSLRKGKSPRPHFGTHRHGTKHATHGAADAVKQYVYRQWRVRIQARDQGVTVKRLIYSVHLEGPTAPFHHRLTTFRSQAAADQAAKRFIDDWHDEHRETLQNALRRGSARILR